MSPTRPSHELLHSIQETVGKELCPAVVRRLLRVPPVWQALHQAGVLETALREHARDLTPADIVRTIDDPNGVQMIRHERLISGEVTPDSVEDLAVLRAYLMDGLDDPPEGEPEHNLLEKVNQLRRGGAWALACTWPDLPDDVKTAERFLRTGSGALFDALTTSILANSDPDAAASELLAAQAHWVDLFSALDPEKEPELAAAIAQRVIDEGLVPERLGTLDVLFAEGISQQALQRTETAAATLEKAYRLTSERGALIADRMAELAYQNGDPMMAVQARERALEQNPAPDRRASLALATLRAGDPMKATQLISAPYKSDEERIAAATVHVELGQSESAHEALTPVEVDSLDGKWQERLGAVWQDLEEPQRAIEAMQAAVHSRPVVPELRAGLAELLLRAGDSQAAAGEAALAAYLSPSSLSARRTLAHSLENTGEHKRALNEWLAIAEHDPSVKPAVVETALRAEEPSTALTFAQELLAEDGNSAVACTAMGKALVAAGNPESGREHLKRATSIAPDDAQAWIALARAEDQLDEAESAGKTLQAAVQSCPSDAELRSELADWLVRSDRWSEAAEHARKALDLEPYSPDHILRCARLEERLGHVDEARSMYEKVYQLRPADVDVRTSLAHMYETTQEYEQALDILGSLPEEAAASDRALLGRLLVRTFPDDGDPARGKEALAALQQAEENGFESDDIDYWKGRAYALSGNYQSSMRSYQACLKSLPESARDLREACLLAQADAALADGQTPVAISLLESAIESNFSSAPIHTRLAKAYLAASLPEEALHSTLKAVELDPDHPGARTTLIESAKASEAWDLLVHKSDQWQENSDEPDPFAFDRALALHHLDRAGDARDAIARAIWPRRHETEALREAAQVLRSIEQPEDAQRLLLTAKSHQPDETEISAELAQAALEAGDYETAYDAWAELIDREPENETALIGAAQALWNLDRRAASIGLLQRAVKQRPDDGDLHAKLARVQLENGEISQALEHYRRAVELNPEATDTAWDAAQALLRHDAPQYALRVLKSLLTQEPENERALLAMAESYLRLGKAKETLATIGRLPAHSVHAGAEALRCLAYRELGERESAEQALEAALANEPRSVGDLRRQLQAALAFGRWQGAETLLHATQIEDFEALNALVMGRLRLADARWLFSVRGDSQHHAPEATAIANESIQSLLDKITQAEFLSEHQRQLLEEVLLLAFGERETSELSRATHTETVGPWARSIARDSWIVALLREGKPEDAMRLLSTSPSSSVVSEWIPLLAGLANFDLESYGRARKAFGAVASESHLRSAAAYFTGLTWLKEGRRDEAINALNSAVLSCPDEPGWQHKLATLYMTSGMPETALPHLQQALEQQPENVELKTDYALALKRSGQLTEAEEMFAEILPNRERDNSVWRTAAETALALGNPEIAEQRYGHVLELDPQDAAARIGAAKSALANGDRRGSHEHVEHILQQPPTAATDLIQLGQLLMEHDRNDKALDVFDQALRSTDRPMSVHRARSQLLLKLGRAQEAIQALQRVVEVDPGDDQAWSSLAEGYRLANQPDQAVDALRMAIEARPGSVKNRLRLARMYRAAGQLDQALDLLIELEREAPQNSDVAFELGRVHEDRRQHQRALHHFERAIQLNNKSAAAHFHAGMVLKALKAYGKAANMFRQAADLNPNDSDALHQLAAVQALDLVHGGRNQQTSAVTT